MKTCKKCGQEKEAIDFYSHKGTADRLNTTCKSCCRALDKAWYRKRITDLSFRQMKRNSAKKSYQPIKIKSVIPFESLDGEIWRDCMEALGFYQVSNLGRVCSLISGYPRLLIPYQNKGGYLTVGLRRISSKTVRKSVHRLVAQAFIDNPKNLPMVNHLNAVKTDNKVGNLEWANHESNTSHAKSLGLYIRRRQNN